AQNAGQSVQTGPLGGQAGARWTPHESDQGWYGLASSADGLQLVAAAYGGKIYTSSDGGLNWTPRDTPRRGWIAAASAADGNKLVAADHDGRLYTSADSGVSWTPRESERAWTFVASSADGSKLVAVVANGPIFTSSDSGETWTEHNADQPDWIAVTSSADGSRLVASADGGAIYTSVATTTPGVGGWISGAAGDAIELQYLGGGMFAVKDRVGMPGFQ